VLPLLATQILWINLVTDGAPALALGLDPADESLMYNPPRPHGERVITGRMWRGILFVGLITALSTLAVFDASLPGGFIEGSGSLPYAQTMTFTTLVLAQLFNVFNARSDERSAFVDVFRNRWVWLSIALSLAFQLAVVYAPVMQHGFGTVDLGLTDWLECAVGASAVLWVREANKLVTRAFAARARR
jgi:Ca2+-transporting ATPase